VREADLLLHVVDISHPDFVEQIQEDTSHMKILIQEIMEMQEIPLIMGQ